MDFEGKLDMVKKVLFCYTKLIRKALFCKSSLFLEKVIRQLLSIIKLSGNSLSDSILYLSHTWATSAFLYFLSAMV